MRIGIDARMLGGKFGLGRYVEELVRHLEETDTENEYRIFLRTENWDAYTPKKLNFKKVRADIPWYSWREQVFFPPIIRRARVDLFHFPHFNVPLLYRGPFVITIHDLIMLRVKGSARSAVTTRHPFIHAFKHACFRAVIRSAVRRARIVLTVSRTVQEEIASTFSVPIDAIRVIYEAGSDLSAQSQELPSDVMRPYVLYVGSCYPHKNLVSLLAAWRLAASGGLKLQLVACGQRDVFSERFQASIREYGLSGQVVWVGEVSDAELSRLYDDAFAVISASTQEGFGLQLLEALCRGVPVLCSNIPAFREIVSDAGMMFNPSDPHDILKALLTLKDNPLLRNTLAARGKKRCTDFDWKRTARETRDVYLSTL